jgi:hypothetical protein
MRIADNPIARLKGKGIIFPGPFALYPHVLRGRLGRPVVCGFGGNGNYEYIIGYVLPITFDPIPFRIGPLRPVTLDKDLEGIGDGPVPGLVFVVVTQPNPFTVYPKGMGGGAGRP